MGGGFKIYQGITVKDIYPNVDVRYYSNNGGVKYDLIIKPGADISRIALKYKGPDKLEIKNKELVIGTSVGELKELAPYCYQHSEKERKDVSCKFVLRNNIVSFEVKNYDPSSTLIIDPSIKFCSFSGSTADNWGFTATYGPDGSMFGGELFLTVVSRFRRVHFKPIMQAVLIPGRSISVLLNSHQMVASALMQHT